MAVPLHVKRLQGERRKDQGRTPPGVFAEDLSSVRYEFPGGFALTLRPQTDYPLGDHPRVDMELTLNGRPVNLSYYGPWSPARSLRDLATDVGGALESTPELVKEDEDSERTSVLYNIDGVVAIQFFSV
jgi:hypothetical protein